MKKITVEGVFRHPTPRPFSEPEEVLHFPMVVWAKFAEQLASEIDTNADPDDLGVEEPRITVTLTQRKNDGLAVAYDFSLTVSFTQQTWTWIGDSENVLSLSVRVLAALEAKVNRAALYETKGVASDADSH